MPIDAEQVRQLRARTGAGVMDCKKALQETDGDIEAAIDQMRRAGMLKAAKRATRAAADGAIAICQGAEQLVMLEVNAETDFVARDKHFSNFVKLLSNTLLTSDVECLEELLALEVDGKPLAQHHQELITRVGENIVVRRFRRLRPTGQIGSYLHGRRIGAAVEIEGGDVELAKVLAMHIAASNPLAISEAELPAELLERERALYAEQEAARDKPADIVEKIISGKMRKFIKTSSLLEQAFIKDADISVRQLLRPAGATVSRFIRFELGEGVEKRGDNFADGVTAQLEGDAS